MRPNVALLLLLASSLPLAGCAAAPPPPTPTALPLPSPTPAPTPTPTPLPPIPLSIPWPDEVSALEDIPVRVVLPGLAERDPAAQVWVRVSDPDHRVWWEANLERDDDVTYVAPLLHLPLEPKPGAWTLTVMVRSAAEVTGERTHRFRPAPVPLRTLSGLVREGVTLSVPQAFTATHAEGDELSGARVWAGGGGEVGLWWAPGPAEPLSLDTARLLAAASRPPSVEVETPSVEPVEWDGLAAFSFAERWSEGVAEALVVQGPDHWLYLLRVRAVGQQDIPPLLREIEASFRVVP